jgi:hypothetical protein
MAWSAQLNGPVRRISTLGNYSEEGYEKAPPETAGLVFGDKQQKLDHAGYRGLHLSRVATPHCRG